MSFLKNSELEKLRFEIRISQAHEVLAAPPSSSMVSFCRCSSRIWRASLAAEKPLEVRPTPKESCPRSRLVGHCRGTAPRERSCTRTPARVRIVEEAAPLGRGCLEMLEVSAKPLQDQLRHVRPKLSCGSCQRIVQPLAPSRPIERGIADRDSACTRAGLQACRSSSCIVKSQIYVPAGIDLRSTLADWVGGRECVARSLGKNEWHYASATTRSTAMTLRCRIPHSRPHGTYQAGALHGRTCAMIGRRAVPIHRRCSSATRLIAKVSDPRAHAGELQRRAAGMDAYAGFDRLYGEKIKEAACWAHVRRRVLRHPCSAFPPRSRLRPSSGSGDCTSRRGGPRVAHRMSATQCARHGRDRSLSPCTSGC